LLGEEAADLPQAASPVPDAHLEDLYDWQQHGGVEE
jgi:hypothetical protein